MLPSSLSLTHHIPSMCCMIRLTAVIPAQQQNPKVRGLPPVFMSLTMSVLRPMAAMARTMKNLLSSLRGENTDISIPADTHTVVIMEAAIK